MGLRRQAGLVRSPRVLTTAQTSSNSKPPAGPVPHPKTSSEKPSTARNRMETHQSRSRCSSPCGWQCSHGWPAGCSAPADRRRRRLPRWRLCRRRRHRRPPPQWTAGRSRCRCRRRPCPCSDLRRRRRSCGQSNGACTASSKGAEGAEGERTAVGTWRRLSPAGAAGALLCRSRLLCGGWWCCCGGWW